MSEPKTLVQAMNDLSASFKELQRQVAGTLIPSLERLHEQTRPLVRRWDYLQRVKRWLPYVLIVFFLCVLIGWWVT